MMARASTLAMSDAISSAPPAAGGGGGGPIDLRPMPTERRLLDGTVDPLEANACDCRRTLRSLCSLSKPWMAPRSTDGSPSADSSDHCALSLGGAGKPTPAAPTGGCGTGGDKSGCGVSIPRLERRIPTLERLIIDFERFLLRAETAGEKSGLSSSPGGGGGVPAGGGG